MNEKLSTSEFITLLYSAFSRKGIFNLSSTELLELFSLAQQYPKWKEKKEAFQTLIPDCTLSLESVSKVPYTNEITLEEDTDNYHIHFFVPPAMRKKLQNKYGDLAKKSEEIVDFCLLTDHVYDQTDGLVIFSPADPNGDYSVLELVDEEVHCAFQIFTDGEVALQDSSTNWTQNGLFEVQNLKIRNATFCILGKLIEDDIQELQVRLAYFDSLPHAVYETSNIMNGQTSSYQKIKNIKNAYQLRKH